MIELIFGRKEELYMFLIVGQINKCHFTINFMKIILKINHFFSIPNACRKLAIPSLIVHGDKDQTVNFKEAEELHKNISNSILLKIKNADHVFNSKHPFNEKLISNEIKKVIANTISFFKN